MTMVSHSQMIFVLAMMVLTLCPTSVVRSDDQLTDDQLAERDFTLKVLPLLKSKCFACHGDDPQEVKGDFDIRNRAGLLRGGESGEASIVPGHPEQSPLFLAVQWDGMEMPPKENDRLTEKQIEILRQWIVAGAPWPSEVKQQQYRLAERSVLKNEDGMIVGTSGGLSDQWTYRRYDQDDLWAFQPLQPVEPPAGIHPVDYFLKRERDVAGVDPSSEADPRTLIRRATFDLIGLPPTPKEIQQFLAEWNQDSEKAWTGLIDRLLASPQYGEHWAQHWLDVTRYADTGGMSNDYERSNHWRYRDYVIRSFNQDKPYNEFIIEQIAGDELADESVRDRHQGNMKAVYQTQLNGHYTDKEAEWIVATGFLRLGPWDNAMTETDEARQIYIDDIVNVVGQTFLSTTMRCFKCHDHKFDPLPTRDYYRMYAAFTATQLAERNVPFLPEENREGFEEGRAHVQRLLDFAVAEKEKLIAKREAAARKWFKEHNLPYQNERDRRKLPDEEKPPRHVGLNLAEQGQLKVREQDERIWSRRLERYQPMAQSVYNSAQVKLAWNGARKLRIDKKANRQRRPESFILIGGALTAKGGPVGPGVLSVIGLPVNASAADPYLIPEDVSGRRLALAKWIANPRNPLTSRSIVNRIWQHHFGRGIAANPNNFGAKGAKPTHPELLDFLAKDFLDHGWTIKRMHRLLMTSAAYRQSSHHDDREQLRTVDPDNDLLAYYPQRRLTAEELRDTMLFVTGELNFAQGGLPIRPEINMEVALQPRMIQFSLAPTYQPSPTPGQRNRRTIYAYRVRGMADPFLELFNQPNPNESCESRDSAAVSPQALTLLNSDVVTDRSIAFAQRLQAETDSAPAEEKSILQIQRAFQLALGRKPTLPEQQHMQQYLRDMLSYHQEHQPQDVTYPTEITRSLVEEQTGQVFEYQEILPVFEHYVSDDKAADVSPETRSLADLCLLLFNTNEFAYIQ